jgi:meso-butanediol dehydrogenase / (S,S)-butanediol dehydrogenase / diacetyl reductase
MSANRLEGKVALITGTAGGQGRAAALSFARQGARVIGCDIKAEANRETAEQVRSEGGSMLGLQPVDLSDPSQVEEFVARAASEWGGLDIVYNNASAQRFAPFGEMSLEDWDFTIRNDLYPPFLVSRYAWKHLIDRGGGSIINISSVAALVASRSFPIAAHAAAKAGVNGLTRALAAEGAPHQIRANCICPAHIETPVSVEYLASEVGARTTESVPLGRVGQPEEVVACALYLASDESSFVTGGIFVVDGGMSSVLP